MISGRGRLEVREEPLKIRRQGKIDGGHRRAARLGAPAPQKQGGGEEAEEGGRGLGDREDGGEGGVAEGHRG